ncbi:hypothetical protein [Kitasatospora sp. GP82]|uniref:hypothetical protein n=1 Tax=Kitasatospora sp. GP82 TaxID=3035089 RepID=UPI002474FAC6|nr:hypothetical protein [Kitasatospora sp. GP82]MDH6130493.1 hypothetical protein [Kitasatospora sp. GP82]
MAKKPSGRSRAEDSFAQGLADLIGSGLEQLRAQNPSVGFTLVADSDKPRKPANTHGGSWVATDRELLANVWRFEFSSRERAVLDIMTAEINEDGQWHGKQSELATRLGCSQGSVSKAISKLESTHFAWKIIRCLYQVNPDWAFGWGTEAHLRSIERLGAAVMDMKRIKIPYESTRKAA